MEFPLTHSSFTDISSPKLAVVMGPTASGKTAFAERLADELHAQLINADAFQVYIGMDIGTAKSPRKDDYLLTDIVEPSQQFGFGEWVQLASQELSRLYQEKRSAVIVGGSGLYIRALTEGFDSIYPAPPPELRERLNTIFSREGLAGLHHELARIRPLAEFAIDLQNPVRVIREIERQHAGPPRPVPSLPPFETVKSAILAPKEETALRIEKRYDEMIEQGWIDETAGLIKSGYCSDDPGFKAHGYRRICEFLEGRLGASDLRRLTILEIVQYAKRQRTWLRKEPNVKFIESKDALNKSQSASSFLFR